MQSSPGILRFTALAALTIICLIAAASLGLLRPKPAYAQACANGACTGIICMYSPTYSCSFPDRNSCTTRRCAFVLEQ
jgi:hypothetical protein